MTNKETFSHTGCAALLAGCIFFILACFPGGASAKERLLLIINSYQETAPWTQEVMTPLSLQIAKADDIRVSMVHLRNDVPDMKMEDGIFRRFDSQKPDYVVLIGSMAFMLRDRIVREWGHVPMLVIAETDLYGPREYYQAGQASEVPEDALKPMADLRDRYNFTLVEVPDLYRQTIDMMMQMLPQMQRLVFNADESSHSRHLNHLIRAYMAEKYPHCEYEWSVGGITHNSTTGVLLCTWFYEPASTYGYPRFMLGDTHEGFRSEFPVFALRSTYLQDGITGGYFPDPKQMRETLSDAFGKMLEGQSMQEIPFTYTTKSVPIVNYPQLMTNRISAELCPKGTIFLDKPLNFWQLYAWQLVLIACAICTLLIVLALNTLFQRKRIGLLNKYDRLVNNMPIAYTRASVCYNPEGRVEDIDFHSGNDSFRELIRKNALPETQHKLFPPEYISDFTEQVLETQLPVTFSHYFKQTDTYYEFLLCPVEKEENSVDVFAVDITTRSKAENELQTFTKKLNLTLTLARIVPWRWDLRSGRIIRERRHDSNASGYIVKDSTFFDRIHPEDRERIKAAYNDLTTGRSQYVKAEFRVESVKNGREHTNWLEINATIGEYDQQHHPTVLLGSLLIITGRKLQEQALIDAREQAKEADRLKSVFFANMNHEIRTPLNAIVGFSNMLARTEDEEKKRKFINIIENNNQLLLQLISDVLDLAKVEANTLDFFYQTVELNDLLRNIENSVRLRVKEGVTLSCFPGMAECTLRTEPNRLSQVLINLLTNANKFTTEGSIMFGYEVQGQELYFYVKDTGLGISEENQKRLFQRFAKLNNFAQGTGLGLSISKGIIEKMGGRIGVYSEGEGKGTMFWFTIPYQPEEKKETAEITETAAVNTFDMQGVTILVAEDNESNFLLFESILEPDYKLIHAWDGKEAVELYKEYRPQVILMDISMPNMDGYEATKEIRKLSGTVPIIAVTAYAFASDKKRILENGFNSYVAKPLNADKLLQEVQSMLRKSLKMQ